MALSSEQLQQIAALLDAAACVREAAGAVRAAFPGLRAMVVDALDVRGETAVLSVADRRVFLVESAGHCWHVTDDPQRAGGVMLVQG
jgi:hypothetical protein